MAARCGSAMTSSEQIDDFLAAALRGERPPWPQCWDSPAEQQEVLERVAYHGIAAMLLDSVPAWPVSVRDALKARSFDRACWELRHRAILEQMIDGLAARNVEPLFLKGTALAYSVYNEPAARDRGDTDLLIHPRDLEAARLSLAACGFTTDEVNSEGDSALQEVWRLRADGYSHIMDLHWAAFNTAYLDDVLAVEECFANAEPITRLHPWASRLLPAYCLLHTAIHRNLHRTAPYFSGGSVNFGANRLIWAMDIALLAQGFGDADWAQFVQLAKSKGVARAMGEALQFARSTVNASIPATVLDQFGEIEVPEPRSVYLLESGRRSRALTNFLSLTDGTRRLQRLRSLATPPDLALRARYPDWAGAPRFLLLARRLIDFALSSRR